MDFYFDTFLPYFKKQAINPCLVEQYQASKGWTSKEILLAFDSDDKNSPRGIWIADHSHKAMQSFYYIVYTSPDIVFDDIQHVLPGYYEPLFQHFNIPKSKIGKDMNTTHYLSIITKNKSNILILKINQETMMNLWVKGLRLMLGQLDTKHTNEEAKKCFDNLQ